MNKTIIKISFLSLFFTFSAFSIDNFSYKNLRLEDIRAQIGADIALQYGFNGALVTVISADVFALTDPRNESGQRILPPGVKFCGHGHQVEEIIKAIAPSATFVRAKKVFPCTIIQSDSDYEASVKLEDFMPEQRRTVINMSYYCPYLVETTRLDEIRAINLHLQIKSHFNFRKDQELYLVPAPKEIQRQEAEIRYAASKGALVVVASGNSGEVFGSTPRTKRMIELADEINLNPDIAGAVLYVGSTARREQSLSNKAIIPKHSSLAGSAHQHFLMALGAGIILSSWHQDPECKVSEHERFRIKNGTSFASPAVSGAAALLWQKFPEASGKQIAILLLKNARRWANPDLGLEAHSHTPDLGDIAPNYIYGHGELSIGTLFEPDSFVKLDSHSEWPILGSIESSEQKIRGAYYDYFSLHLKSLSEEIHAKLLGMKKIEYGPEIWSDDEVLKESHIVAQIPRLIYSARARYNQLETINELAMRIQQLENTEFAENSPYFFTEKYIFWRDSYRTMCLSQLYAGHWFLSKNITSMKKSLSFFSRQEPREFEDFLWTYFNHAKPNGPLLIPLKHHLYGQDKDDFLELIKNLRQENFFNAFPSFLEKQVSLLIQSEHAIKEQKRQRDEANLFN